MDTPGTFVEVAARPQPFRMATATTAVVVVDMQNDFAAVGGMFGRAGIDITGIRAIVPTVQAVLAAARDAGIPIVYLKMGFQPGSHRRWISQFATWLKHLPLRAGDEVTSSDGEPSRILVRDCWNTDIVQELVPLDGGDVVLYKTRYSGFYATELDAVLRSHGIEQLVVGRCDHECVRGLNGA